MIFFLSGKKGQNLDRRDTSNISVKTSIAMKSILASFFSKTGGMSRKLNRVSKHDSVILMYHRVVPHDEVRSGIQAGMYVEPYTFERHLGFLKKHFVIVPISALLSDYEEVSGTLDAKPRCVLTFDDGWHDFFEYVFPILKTHQVQATVFLPTDFMGTGDWFWTDRLGNLLYQREKSGNSVSLTQSSTNSFVRRLEGLNDPIEGQIEKAIGMLKALHNEKIEEILRELSARWNLDAAPGRRAFFNWEEVREMAQSGLVTFGSHTVGHKILTTLTEPEIRDELANSRKRLVTEKAVDPAFISFSYPNGNYTDRIAKMVRDSGYDLAVTTENGWNHNGSDLFALKRISIHQDMTSTEAMLGCRILGIF